MVLVDDSDDKEENIDSCVAYNQSFSIERNKDDIREAFLPSRKQRALSILYPIFYLSLSIAFAITYVLIPSSPTEVLFFAKYSWWLTIANFGFIELTDSCLINVPDAVYLVLYLLGLAWHFIFFLFFWVFEYEPNPFINTATCNILFLLLMISVTGAYSKANIAQVLSREQMQSIEGSTGELFDAFAASADGHDRTDTAIAREPTRVTVERIDLGVGGVGGDPHMLNDGIYKRNWMAQIYLLEAQLLTASTPVAQHRRAPLPPSHARVAVGDGLLSTKPTSRVSDSHEYIIETSRGMSEEGTRDLPHMPEEGTRDVLSSTVRDGLALEGTHELRPQWGCCEATGSKWTPFLPRHAYAR